MSSYIIFEGITKDRDGMPSRIAVNPGSVIDAASFPDQPGTVLRYRTGRNENDKSGIAVAYLNHTLDEIVEALNKVSPFF